MESRFESAKEIFFHYDGSKFHMQREGALEEYKSYNIPVEIENDWKKEYTDKKWNDIYLAQTISEKLEFITDYTKALRIFYNSDVICIIDDFMHNLKGLDSYTEIRLIELKLNLLSKSSKNKKKIILDCINSLLRLENEELVVDSSYYIEGELPDYLSKDRLKIRIKNSIEYCKSQL